MPTPVAQVVPQFGSPSLASLDFPSSFSFSFPIPLIPSYPTTIARRTPTTAAERFWDIKELRAALFEQTFSKKQLAGMLTLEKESFRDVVREMYMDLPLINLEDRLRIQGCPFVRMISDSIGPL